MVERTPSILLSGFEPFQLASVNPSWEIAKRLRGQEVAGHRIEVVQLPCVFAHRAAALLEAIQALNPSLVLAMGLAAGRTDLSFERVAINLIDAPIPDNDGAMPQEVPVMQGGPVGYFSELPLRAMVQAVRAAGVPASISQSAGTYVCNQVFYLLQHTLQNARIPSGFLHVPLLPQQVAHAPPNASIALERQCQGVVAALAQAVAPHISTNVIAIEGKTH